MIEPPALIPEIVAKREKEPSIPSSNFRNRFSWGGYFCQEDIRLPTAEPTILVSEEGVDPIVEESLSREGIAPKIEAAISTISFEMTTRTFVMGAPDVPITDLSVPYNYTK